MIQILYNGRKFGNVTEDSNGRTVTYSDAYTLPPGVDLLFLSKFLPRYGQAVLFNPVYWCERWEMTPVAEGQLNGRDVWVNVTASTKRDDRSETDANGEPIAEDTPPWLYRLENWQISSASEEVAATVYYPTASNVALPFVNTAGVFLEAPTSRALLDMSFTYNVETFDVNYIASFVGRVNASQIDVGGITFPARTVRIEQLDAEEVTEYNQNGSIRWRYVKVKPRLLCDPRTFNRDFLNVGTALRSGGGLKKIWTWTSGGSTNYGTYQQALNASADDAEEISDPMFLNAAGTAISPFTNDGRQVPTYISGCLDVPIDFTPLKIPSVR